MVANKRMPTKGIENQSRTICIGTPVWWTTEKNKLKGWESLNKKNNVIVTFSCKKVNIQFAEKQLKQQRIWSKIILVLKIMLILMV